MNRLRLKRRPAGPALLALAWFGLLAGCQTRPVPTAPVAGGTAVVPAARDERWLARHDGFLARSRAGGVDVLFLGDSITDRWRNDNGGQAVWQAEMAPLGAANYGIGGDRTQHVLWRLEHGELDGISPRVVVLLIGTNNTGFERDGVTVRNPPAETAAGVALIVRTLRAKVPDARILLLGVFPRGERPDHPQRLQVAEINRLIAPLHEGKHVFFYDFGARFLGADGTIAKSVMPDFLHPGPAGYAIWADAIREPLRALLQDQRVNGAKAMAR